jgi:hypothetical protein
MFTGKRVMTVGYRSELPDDMSSTYFDDWPIIWKQFARIGYRTFYAEDYPQYNLFKYLSMGFRSAPTDHYFRSVSDAHLYATLSFILDPIG